MRITAFLILAASFLLGCNPSGACTDAQPPGSCLDIAKNSCKGTAVTFHEGASCKGLGYTKCDSKGSCSKP
jgi:hypothetical protein